MRQKPQYHELALRELIQANEENMAEAYGVLYSAWDEARSHVGQDVVWGLTRIPSPFVNSATRVRFTDEQADGALEAIIEVANARHVPMRWWLGPGTQPADTGRRLLERGFSHEQLTGMAIDLSSTPTPQAQPAMSVERVRDSASLADWCKVLAAGFAVPRVATDGFGRAFESVGLDSPDWRLYLAYLDGEPVAASSAYLGTSVAGIYSVATLPEARGKGAGTAVTQAPLRAASQAGYLIATLQASRLGHGVYRRLGFEEICKFNLYVSTIDD